MLQQDLLSILQAYVEVSRTHGEIMLLLFYEAARDPSLQSLIGAPMKNMQPILTIIETYQAQGLLREESPVTALYALLGPIMLSTMAQRANIAPDLPEFDIHQHLDFFLNGRGR